jgi:hypothetical protein
MLSEGEVGIADDDVVKDLDAYGLSGFAHPCGHDAVLGAGLDLPRRVVVGEDHGGITMSGKLATQVAKDPRVHLVGYGPSASTIGANRAGRAAARELMAFLGEEMG